ncbi:unnamed protein product, partial [Pylaiella littoralis]
ATRSREYRYSLMARFCHRISTPGYFRRRLALAGHVLPTDPGATAAAREITPLSASTTVPSLLFFPITATPVPTSLTGALSLNTPLSKPLGIPHPTHIHSL